MSEQSTNHSVRSIVLAVLIITSTAAVPMTATAASDNNGFLDAFTGNTDNQSRLDTLKTYASTLPDFASGFYNRVKYWSALQDPFNDAEQPTAASEARDVQSYFNQHNQSFIDYANNRSAGGTSYDVWKLTFKQDGESETVYLVADYNTSSNEYTSAEIVNSTSRSVDETVTLDGYAAANAQEELEHFHQEFVTTDTAVTKDYESHLASKYAGHVESSLLEGDS